jgi:hypothetical protein
MEILKNIEDRTFIINGEQSFKTDAGWQENMDQLEEEILGKIINPIENYETVRYIHSPYTSNNNVQQSDIWFYFYFLDGTSQYTNGIDYNLVGITSQENAKMLKQSTESFFRLEFYKTPNDDVPDRTNRRLVFAKNLSLPLGEKYFYTTLNDYIHLPVFTGSNYRNKENMYLFWFQDETAFNETTLTGNTFWMSARFFNAKDGSVIDFTTTGLTSVQEVVEYRDMYYKVVINKTDYSYQVFNYNGTVGSRVGFSNQPIKFYEKRT